MRAAEESLHQPVTSTNTFLLLKHNLALSWLTWSLGERGKRFCSPSYWKTMDRRKTMTSPLERLPSHSMRAAKTDDTETWWSKIILHLFVQFSEVPTDLLTNAICDQLFHKPYYIYLELSLDRILCWLGRRCGNTFVEAMGLNLFNDFKTAFSFIQLILKTFYSSRRPPGFQDLFLSRPGASEKYWPLDSRPPGFQSSATEHSI